MTKDEILTMKPGPELDALVAQKVFGHSKPKHYSTDISAAWSVVERLTDLGYELDHRIFYDNDIPRTKVVYIEFWKSREPNDVYHWCELKKGSTPEAISKAALMVAIEKNKEKEENNNESS